MERSLLDKMVNGAFLGKRKMGRPLKYNIRNKGSQGWVDLYFNPTSRVERAVSTAMRFIHPYLFHVTYKFHVSQARDAGKCPSPTPLRAEGPAPLSAPQATKLGEERRRAAWLAGRAIAVLGSFLI